MALKEYLLQTAKQIQDIEAKAKKMLSAGNKQEYVSSMHKKAHILAALYDNARKQDVSDIEQAENVLLTLHGFYERAEKSLQVNSPWFMSALLYPEDYREGEPNNLEKLIQSL